MAPCDASIVGGPPLTGPQRALEERTREALTTLTKVIHAAQSSAFDKVHVQLSQLLLENRQLREQLGATANVDELEAVALPETIGKPAMPAGECAVFDDMLTLPSALDAFARPPQVRPQSRGRDAWEAAKVQDDLALPGQVQVQGDRFADAYQRTSIAHMDTPEQPRASRNMVAKLRMSARHSMRAAGARDRLGLTDTPKPPGLVHAKNPRRLFPAKTELAQRVQETLVKPEYKVTNFYHEDGLAQMLARNPVFENTTLFVIVLNSIWIAIDTDYNTTPLNPALIFIVVENLFCAYFFFEVVVRFLAFESKRDCLHSYWFVFDAVLVTVAVLETWVMVLIGALTGITMASLTGRSGAMLRLLRMARLARTARMARLLRAVPEVMIMFKGMIVASHAVLCTMFVLAIILYVFALCLRQLTMDSALGESHFQSVPSAMGTLLLRGTLPDIGDFVYDLSGAHILLGSLGLCFVLLTMLVVLNMLAGVLVNVVLVVADLEKEEADAMFVRNALGVILNVGDVNGDKTVSKSEFENLLVNPDATNLLEQVNVDVMGLVELSDFIFIDAGDGLRFEEFFKLVLKLRGSKSATVKDIVEMRKFIVQEVSALENYLGGIMNKILIQSKAGWDGSGEDGILRPASILA